MRWWSARRWTSAIEGRLIIQEPLEAADIKYRHDRQLLRMALEHAIQAFEALRGRDKQLPHLMQLVTDIGGLFKLQILRVLLHLRFQLVNFLLQPFRCTDVNRIAHLQQWCRLALPRGLFFASPWPSSRISAIFLFSPCGTMPFSTLYFSCFSRRRSVSPMARAIDGVILSP